MMRNPAPHQIDARVPYLRIKPDCKWAGIVLNNVIVDQGIVYSEKDIQRLVDKFRSNKHEKVHHH